MSADRIILLPFSLKQMQDDYHSGKGKAIKLLYNVHYCPFLVQSPGDDSPDTVLAVNWELKSSLLIMEQSKEAR